MPRRIITPTNYLELKFPTLGQDVSTSYTAQRPGTTPYALNCRAWEPSSLRMRGGSRPGINKFNPLIVKTGSPGLVQELVAMSVVKSPVVGTVPVTAPSGFVLLLIAISQGVLRVMVSGDTTGSGGTPQWYAPFINGSPVLTFAGNPVIRAAANIQKLWITDGLNYSVYDPDATTHANGVLSVWTASAGTMPTGTFTISGTPTTVIPRLIETWRSRQVLSGLQTDPNNVFMSAVGDPTNWDYSPAAPSPTQAVALAASPLGIISSPVTAIIPYTDDILILGTQTQIYMVQGDPMAGGSIQLITSAVGIAWGRAWTMDPYGNVYFMSNRGGLYMLTPGSQPQRISQQVESIVNAFQVSLTNIRMLWDDTNQGLMVFNTVAAGAANTTHLFWDQRQNAWWPFQFGNINQNPLAVAVMEGYTSLQRVPVLGSWDGFVRGASNAALDDDGTPIVSTMVIGPVLTEKLDDILIKDMQALLGMSSGSVTYGIVSGTTPEIAMNPIVGGSAFNGTPIPTGTWNAGRNVDNLIRKAGHAHYIYINATGQWQFETCRLGLITRGKVRARAF